MNFTIAKIKKLQKEYDKAVKKGDKIFVFEGTALLVNYAKYLLQHLDNEMLREVMRNKKKKTTP